ncbi:Bug family tripartite tricarboxylate transporter substrate binding protein [Falsirhodobacter sp. 20TX0035]|uniref:Bug family tripartite tricarboxylate transporter substrate binding protein n=1 Tax=Falsirhodobacter sp. 20TX0035 TaxID=3022019 RepID=UPI0023305889|nr:tripartite tricarboxylate transporter substrate binding protein [Falsirhodobacter sp. 20TX0035]MDB6454518.1 tripartite tricarboxylate transporter substrate binding protein [Falsirhodobacter sp. 20TX0035]
MIQKIHTLCRAAAAIALLGALPAQAQDWPTEPLRLFVGFPAGSSPDAIARLVAEPLSQALGQPVVVDNRPGAGGVIGVQQMVARARTGHSFGMTINGPLTTSQRLLPDLAYDPATDVAPVALIATSPLVLTVAADFPANDIAGFVAEAKAHPNDISYGSVGPGSGAHLTTELFAAATGTELYHIPFQSYAQVTTSLLAGDVDSGFMAPSAALPFVKTGELKMLGVTSAEPFPQAPDVPVIAGQGGAPGDFRAELWNAFIAPAGTDPAVIARLNAEINRILSDEGIRKTLLDLGWEATPGTPEDLAARIKADTVLWGRALYLIEAKAP